MKFERTTNSFMQVAIELAVQNVQSGKGGPFGAVIVKQGTIIGRGTNLVTSTYDPTAHAEVVAVRNACRTLNHFALLGCDLYSTCAPCPMCLGALYWSRIDRVYFGTQTADAAVFGFDDAYIYDQILLPAERRAIPMLQIMRDEALKAFHVWRAKSDKILY